MTFIHSPPRDPLLRSQRGGAAFGIRETDIARAQRIAAEHALARRRRHLIVKRAFDLPVSALLLILSSPVLIVAALAIKVSAPGPVFYRQARVGRNGRPFTITKLRTMVVEQAGAPKTDYLGDHSTGRLFKSADDPRITKVGRFLRRTSIDELPQLFDVFRGDMSLIGPRPLFEFMVKPYPEIAHARTLVRPGITGMWQVSARVGSDSVLAMAEPDLYYLQNYSLWLDARILLKTIPACVRGQGAI